MKLNEWTGLQRGRALALARHLDVKPPVVSDWCTEEKQIPLERCVPIERFTNQEVTCEEMRPDKAADFAYLRGLADEVAPAPAQNPPADALPGAAGQASAEPVAGWDGVDRRHTVNPPHPDIERREHEAARLAAQGV